MSADAQTATRDEFSETQNILTEKSQDFTHKDPTILQAMPAEILSEIFRWTLPWSRRTPVMLEPAEVGLYDSERPVVTAPWRLGFVCKLWRECALGDPLLWSTIELDFFAKSDLQIAECYPVAALETQLLRSGEAPLDVTVNLMCFDIPPPSTIVDILAVLVAQSYRWVKLNFEWESPSPEICAVLRRITGQVQLLQRLELRSPPLATDMKEMFEVAPQLREFLLLDPYTDHDYSRDRELSAPWEQLTHLRTRSSTGRCIEILARTELLVECSLGNPTRPDPGSDVVRPGTPIVFLPHLRRFSVTQYNLLAVLSAPRLEYLFLGFRIDDDSTYVLPFLQRSQCQLLGLTLIRWLPADLPPLLRNIPTLRHLQADCNDDGVDLDDLDPTYSSPAADVLFRTLADTTICPHLESIYLAFWMPCTYEDAYDFILARTHDTPLRFASFCTEGPPLSDVRERLLSLATRDLDIIVADRNDPDTNRQPLENAEKDMEPPCM
ncbi:hypothetical protein C8R46DRAFT_1289703 [Mycena filopes]|nr:hypothetical protein C8R46DRAFT_1289703 [Mycena filopes]